MMANREAAGDIESCWHWSNTQSSASHAFAQNFGCGGQGTVNKGAEFAAVFVRS